MEEAAPQATARHVPAPADWWCRHCGEPVTLLGDGALEMSMRQAVHAATGLEEGPGSGPDGRHFAAPTGTDPAKTAAARRIMEACPGWRVAWYYSHFRAWMQDYPTVVPVEADTEEEMLRRLGRWHAPAGRP
jgi:hypothetical protein